MTHTSRYHPSVVIVYMILLGTVIIVGLSNRLKSLPPDRHADALTKAVWTPKFKPDDELEEKAG